MLLRGKEASNRSKELRPACPRTIILDPRRWWSPRRWYCYCFGLTLFAPERTELTERLTERRNLDQRNITVSE